MRNWIKRHPFLTLSLMLTLPLWVYMGGNLSGYCWEEERWLGNYEIMDRAFKYTQGGPQGALLTKEQSKEYSKENHIPYKDLTEFRRSNHPACCEIRPANCPLLYKLLGRCLVGVSLHYQVRYRSSDGTIKSFPTYAAPGMTNCGRTFTHYFN